MIFDLSKVSASNNPNIKIDWMNYQRKNKIERTGNPARRCRLSFAKKLIKNFLKSKMVIIKLLSWTMNWLKCEVVCLPLICAEKMSIYAVAGKVL